MNNTEEYESLGEAATKYGRKHSLEPTETIQLYLQLVQDRKLYGNAYLDMEKGRINPHNKKID